VQSDGRQQQGRSKIRQMQVQLEHHPSCSKLYNKRQITPAGANNSQQLKLALLTVLPRTS
jgi:hypothetical protein